MKILGRSNSRKVYSLVLFLPIVLMLTSCKTQEEIPETSAAPATTKQQYETEDESDLVQDTDQPTAEESKNAEVLQESGTPTDCPGTFNPCGWVYEYRYPGR